MFCSQKESKPLQSQKPSTNIEGTERVKVGSVTRCTVYCMFVCNTTEVSFHELFLENSLYIALYMLASLHAQRLLMMQLKATLLNQSHSPCTVWPHNHAGTV